MVLSIWIKLGENGLNNFGKDQHLNVTWFISLFHMYKMFVVWFRLTIVVHASSNEAFQNLGDR